MAIQFNQHKGAAQKSSITSFQYKDGDNSFRLVGDILARYVYWVKGENDKNIPLECLSFDRNNESFNNKEKDWVREYYPDLKCGWSYATQCIDGGQVKVVNLKKKLWEHFLKRFPLIQAAGGVVQHANSKILFIYRNNLWDMPKGRVEKNEIITDGALREVMEETGCLLYTSDAADE